MVAKSKKPEYPEQDAEELKAMADFYSKQYGEVWFLRCLNCTRIIAVEVPTASGNVPVRGRQIYGYQELFITTRVRLDKTPDGKPMVGYECRCGNDTRLADVERGEVPTTTAIVKDGAVVQAAPPISLSPFERERMRTTVALKQAGSKKKADYEINGTTERFETFQLERVA